MVIVADNSTTLFYVVHSDLAITSTSSVGTFSATTASVYINVDHVVNFVIFAIVGFDRFISLVSSCNIDGPTIDGTIWISKLVTTTRVFTIITYSTNLIGIPLSTPPGPPGMIINKFL